MAKGLADVLAEQRNAKLPPKPQPRSAVAQPAEQTAVNRSVAGSNPARGATHTPRAQTSAKASPPASNPGGDRAFDTDARTSSLEPEELDDVAAKTRKVTDEHWGYHLLIDMSECNQKINSNEAIGSFFDELVNVLKMKKLAGPRFIDVHGVEGRGVEGRGVTAFQPITTSHISIHTDDDKMSAYCDVFSCAPFEPKKALACVEKWFAPKHIGARFILRDADL